MCVCVCVCVCVWREKGRGALKKASSLKSNTMYYFIAVNLQEAFDFKSKLLILRSSLPVCPTLTSSRSLWWSGSTKTKPASTDQLRNSQTIDCKRVCKWCQCHSTLKGQTRGVLGKRHHLCCGQPLSVDLDHRVSRGQEKRRQIVVEPASVTD